MKCNVAEFDLGLAMLLGVTTKISGGITVR